MQPKGHFITDINKTQPGQPTIGQTFYYAVTSQFEAKLKAEHWLSELPEQLIDQHNLTDVGLKGENWLGGLPMRLTQMLMAGFMDQLMGEDNDLVVNTASMKAIDTHSGNFIKDSLDLATNPYVHHLNYFDQPKVIDALTRWLRLDKQGTIARTAVEENKAKRRLIKWDPPAKPPETPPLSNIRLEPGSIVLPKNWTDG
jgi:hypothetical protein